LSPNSSNDDLKFGDLVTMTIIDVFETDSDGKLLSYCPTFDNRAVHKTDQRVEKMRKGSSILKKNIHMAANSPTAAKVNQAANLLGKLSVKYASTVKDTVQRKIEEEMKKKSGETPPTPQRKDITQLKDDRIKDKDSSGGEEVTSYMI
jgi:hypothetical protein